MSSHERPDMDLRTEAVVHEWLGDGPETMPHYLLQDVLQETTTTPQARRRFLGRWLERDEGTGRRAVGRYHAPQQDRRSRLMLSATGVIAVLAIATMVVNVIDGGPTSLDQPGTTHIVASDGSGEFTTIQEAVDAAEDGDTIAVLPGSYTEVITIDKDLTLVGDGPVDEIVITAPEGGPRYGLANAPATEATYALAITGADASVSRVTLHGPDSRLIVDASHAAVTDNRFEDTGETHQGDVTLGGLVAMGSSEVVISGNEFTAGGGPFITDGTTATVVDNAFIDGPEVAGEFPLGSEIRDNTFTGDANVGISILGASDVVIAGNTIRDRYNAIRSYPTAGDTFGGEITDNVISGASTAIAVSTLEGVRITDNTISDGRVGIQLDGSDALVTGNEVTGLQTAVGIFGGAPILEGNVVTGNEAGLSVAGGATPTLVGNLICGNDVDVASLDELDLSANAPCDATAAE